VTSVSASAPSERRPQPDSDSRDDRSARKGTKLEEEKHEEKGCSASYGEARMGGISLAFAAFKVNDAYQAINRGRKELSRAREEFEQGIRERSYCCADPDTNPREDDFQEALQIAMFRAKSALGHLQVAESILSDIRNENFCKGCCGRCNLLHGFFGRSRLCDIMGCSERRRTCRSVRTARTPSRRTHSDCSFPSTRQKLTRFGSALLYRPDSRHLARESNSKDCAHARLDKVNSAAVPE
jgi:hypothetical protein